MALPPLSLSALAADIRLDLEGTSGISDDNFWYFNLLAENGNIAPDTDFFVRYMHPDIRALLVRNIDDALFGLPFSEIMRDAFKSPRMAVTRGLENEFLAWRRDNRSASAIASMHTIVMVQQQYLEMMDAAAGEIVWQGRHSFFDESAKQQLARDTHFWARFGILRRSIRRALSDLETFSADDFAELLVAYQTFYRPRRLQRQKNMPPLARSLRAPIKRSIKFLSQLLGPERVRILIGTNEIVVEGKDWDYRFTKTGSIANEGHGSCSLALVKKGSRELIAKLCIYTADVPLLDHVASIVMHIQADSEEHLFTTGNLYAINRTLIGDYPALLAREPPRAIVVESVLQRNRDWGREDTFTKVRQAVDFHLRSRLPELMDLKLRVRTLTTAPGPELVHILHGV